MISGNKSKAGLSRRERFCRLYDFQKVDRPPRWEAVAFWEETLDEWRAQGKIPKDVDIWKHFNIEPRPTVYAGMGFTSMVLSGPPVQSSVIETKGNESIMENDLGQVWRVRTDGVSMPQWIRFPVENHSDWLNKIKPRLNPSSHNYDNFNIHYEQSSHVDTAYAKNEVDDDPLLFGIVGLYAFWRNFWGEEKLAYAFYDYPDTLHDMAKTWLRMHCECSPEVFRKLRIDAVFFHEDMAFKNGPLIGPDMFDEFMTPYYREMFRHLKSFRQHRFLLDSDGNNGLVLDRFAGLGINGLYPFEAAAGCNAIGFARAHPGFVVFGALDKRALLKGREEIKREIMEKVPVLWEHGGFFPSFDHSIMPCAYENFIYALDIIRNITV